ncbi:MAG: protein kinase [Myxococcales bacterium]|nr:protein kinase [Myxococcales bacterium]
MTKGKSPSSNVDLSSSPQHSAKDARRVTQDKMIGVIEPQLLMEPFSSNTPSKAQSVLDGMAVGEDIPIDDIFDSLFMSEKPTPPEEDSLTRKNTSIESAVQLAALEAAEVYGSPTAELQAAPPGSSSQITNADADVISSTSGALGALQGAKTDGALSISSSRTTQFSTPAAPVDLSTMQFAAPLKKSDPVPPSSLLPQSEAEHANALLTTQKQPMAGFQLETTIQDEPFNPHATRVGFSLGQLVNPSELGIDFVQLTDEEKAAPPLGSEVSHSTSEDWEASEDDPSLESPDSFDDIARDPHDDESYDDIGRDEWSEASPQESSRDWGDALNPLQTSMFRAAVDTGIPAPVSLEGLLPENDVADNLIKHTSPTTGFFQGADDVEAFFALSQTPMPNQAPTRVDQPNSPQAPAKSDTLGETETYPLHSPKAPPNQLASPEHAVKVARGDRFQLEQSPQHFSETLPLGRPQASPAEMGQILEGTLIESTTQPMTRPAGPASVGPSVPKTVPNVGATIQDVPRKSLQGPILSVGATIQERPLKDILGSPSSRGDDSPSDVLWSAVPASTKPLEDSSPSHDSLDPEETALEAEIPTALKAMSMDLLEPKRTEPSKKTPPPPQQTKDLTGQPIHPNTMTPQGPIPSGVALTNSMRNTTVLPKVRMIGQAHELVNEARERYEVMRKLGEGAVGEVSLAKDNDIHRLVAIKRLKEAEPHPGSLVRFVEEIQTNGRLEHPNIAPVHDVGIDGEGRYFFVMKYVRGENLEEIITKLREGDEEAHRTYTPHYRVQIALEILRAIQFAHEQGVVHRDLKPSNIIVGPHGEVMVMDWGIAKSIREERPSKPVQIPAHPEALLAGDILQKEERVFETSVGTLIGTPAYMSPEQALGFNDRIDERSDIYSLCALLYEFFSLRHYMAHKTDMKSLLLSIITEPPPPIEKAKSPYQAAPSRILGGILAQGLAKEPAQRYASVQELSQALQNQYLEGHNAIACSYSLVRRSGSEFLGFLERHPKMAPMMAMFVAMFAIFGGVAAAYLIATKFL